MSINVGSVHARLRARCCTLCHTLQSHSTQCRCTANGYVGRTSDCSKIQLSPFLCGVVLVMLSQQSTYIALVFLTIICYLTELRILYLNPRPYVRPLQLDRRTTFFLVCIFFSRIFFTIPGTRDVARGAVGATAPNFSCDFVNANLCSKTNETYTH